MHVPMRAGSENRTSVGEVVGGVLGAVVVLVLVILLVLLIVIILLKRKTGIDQNGNSFLTLYIVTFLCSNLILLISQKNLRVLT